MNNIYYITSLSLCIPVFFGVYYYKFINDLSKIFFYYLVLSLIIEIIGLYLGVRSINNHIIYNMYMFLSNVYVSYLIFKTGVRFSVLISVIIILFFLGY